MKRSTFLPIAAFCGLAMTSYGQTTVVDDVFADGSRSEQNLPTESQWFNGGTGATLTPSPGHLLMGIPTGSASWETYFAADATPVTLANPGDNLTVQWFFTTGTIGAINTSQNFRLAIVDTPTASRLAADAAPGPDLYPGYGMFMNMATTLGNSNPFRLVERNAVNSDLLGTSANWAGLANGATTGAHGYDNTTPYVFTMSLTRNGSSGLDITASMVGGTLNNSGTASLAFTDTTPSSFTFDTFALRPSGSTSTANMWDTTRFYVTQVVPEPTTFALVGMGVLGIAFSYRRSRR